jgi:hypothetical protein
MMFLLLCARPRVLQIAHSPPDFTHCSLLRLSPRFSGCITCRAYGQVKSTSQTSDLDGRSLGVLGRICGSHQSACFVEQTYSGADVPLPAALQHSIRSIMIACAARQSLTYAFPPDVNKAAGDVCKVKRDGT